MNLEDFPAIAPSPFYSVWRAVVVVEAEPFLDGGIDWTEEIVFEDLVCTCTRVANSLGWEIDALDMHELLLRIWEEEKKE